MDFPIVKLTVESMRQEILMALSKFDLRPGLQEAVDRTVAGFDFGRVVREEVESALSAAIKAAVVDAAYAAIRDRRVKKILVEHLAANLC